MTAGDGLSIAGTSGDGLTFAWYAANASAPIGGWESRRLRPDGINSPR